MSSIYSQVTSVAIVGGGPVGLMLALFLDRHNISCVVFNKEIDSRWHPKGNTHNSRTMEHYRRLGISSAIRKLGLPREHPRDVTYYTRYNAWELARIPMASEALRIRQMAEESPTAQVPEPLLRANQMYVEKYLLEHAATRNNITLKFGWNVTDIQQNKEVVIIEAEPTHKGAKQIWHSSYLVGCDGAHSFTRRHLGIDYQGHSKLEQSFLGGRMISSYIKAPEIHQRILKNKKSWLYNVISPDLRMLLISLNGDDEFLMMTKAEHPKKMPDDKKIIETIRRGTGENIAVSIMAHRSWMGGAALVAEKFSCDRVLIAGDASHLFSPTGGFGMNTGIDGVANLAWKLAAMLQGWGGPKLLESYEAERKPIAKRNTSAARALTQRVGEIAVPDNLEEDSPTGSQARKNMGEVLKSFSPQFSSIGVELGARYDGSTLIFPDISAPADSFEVYHPCAIPGGRLPHLWCETSIKAVGLESRQSLFDALGIGFTLLRIGNDAPQGGGFLTHAKKRKIPLKVLTLAKLPAWDLYQRKLVLVRPDQHIAWRGDRSPENPGNILERCVGFY